MKVVQCHFLATIYMQSESNVSIMLILERSNQQFIKSVVINFIW